MVRQATLSTWLDREIGIIVFDSREQKYYHARFMSGPVLAHRIEDPFEFARTADQCSGQLAVSAMSRLQDRLAGGSGTVSYTVRGGKDWRDLPQLKLEVSANFRLRCDWCLMPMDFPLALNTRVLLSKPGAVSQDDDDPETPEWIEVEGELDLLELVEDEILLGLPLAARHDPGKCSGEKSVAVQEDAKDTPFAKLAVLLESGRTGKRQAKKQ